MRTKSVFGVVSFVVGGALSVAACGDSFGASDCAANRTCAAAGGQDSSEAGAAGQQSGNNEAGANSLPNGGASANGGMPNVAGSTALGGAGEGGALEPGCSPAACSDGDASNGAEICDAEGACQPGNPPPNVLEVSPTDKTEDAEPATEVVITFDEPLDEATVTSTSVKLLDGDVEVAGTVAYADSKITFTPTLPLALLGSYEVSVSEDVTDVAGAGLLSAFSSGFAIRDGVWSSIDAVDRPFRFADTLPIADTGDVLLGWIGLVGTYCPTYGRWFNRGVARAAAKAFAVNGAIECQGVAAAGNELGVGAVLWQVPDAQHGIYVQQYRSGTWAAGDGKMSTFAEQYTHPRLAVAPNGVVSLLRSSTTGMAALRTDADGMWLKGSAADVVEATEQTLSPPEAAFDAQGNGLAVWRASDVGAKEQVLAARYVAGKWGSSTTLPGSSSNGLTADFGRGAAVALAIAPNGNAMAVWVRVPDAGTAALVASAFTPAGGWESPVPLTSAQEVAPLNDHPGLVFDGTTFVAAFTASEAGKRWAYSVRYDTVAEGWDAPEKRQAGADLTSAARMPRLATDSRGNLMLVWTTGAAPSYKLVYQRYARGAWGTTQVIAGGAITDAYFETGLDNVPTGPFPLSMNHLGLGALSWGVHSKDGTIGTLRLASFH